MSVKKNNKSPCVSDIFAGNTIVLYDDQGKNCGQVLLIEKLESRYDSILPYVKAEVGGTVKQDSHAIIWTKSRWKVKFLSDGFVTARYVHYFIEEVENEESNF